jgi:alkaline phosphatase D
MILSGKWILTLSFFLYTSSLFSQSKISISFGSCLSQKKDLGILKSISTHSPDHFIFLGDNIYKDSIIIDDKILEYNKLGENIDYRTLRKKSQIFATWDDHDYGINDSGEEYPTKKESQREFLKFFYPKEVEEKMKKEGIYSSEMINFNKLKIHIIILDTRYFRTKLKKKFIFFGGYAPNFDETATILGSTQWQWLESELGKESDVKIIVSSIQFYNEDHPFEKWGNFPLEKKKLLSLLDQTPSKQNLFLSGDRHISESFVFQTPASRQLYEITSSPLNKELPIKLHFPSRIDRLGDVLMDSSFGNIIVTDEKNTYTFQFQYILKNLDKITVPFTFSIQK